MRIQPLLDSCPWVWVVVVFFADAGYTIFDGVEGRTRPAVLPPNGFLKGPGLDASRTNMRMGSFPKCMWLKIKQEGLRRCWSMFPLTRVPFWYRFFEPQPNTIIAWARMGPTTSCVPPMFREGKILNGTIPCKLCFFVPRLKFFVGLVVGFPLHSLKAKKLSARHLKSDRPVCCLFCCGRQIIRSCWDWNP